MNNDIQTAQGNINNILNNREDVYDASGQIRAMKDDVDKMKGLINNPYANLGVATQAAEMQAEQADISLANNSTRKPKTKHRRPSYSCFRKSCSR